MPSYLMQLNNSKALINGQKIPQLNPENLLI